MSEDISFQVSEERETWFSTWFRWCPTSQTLLEEAEQLLFRHVKTSYIGKYVNIGKATEYSESKIWTVCMNERSQNTPIVLLHGFGCGLGLWCLNLDSLAADRPVYAIDLLGFGRSSRPRFSQSPLEVDREFVESIESWRRKIGLNAFILIGHSFGGYLAAAYAIKHPEHVSHLVLVDPWGFPKRPSDISKLYHFPLWVKFCIAMWRPFNTLFFIRAAGPLGPTIMRNAPSDLTRTFRFAPVVENADEVIPNYLYHCNAQIPSGEAAWHNLVLTSGLAWAKYPMINRIGTLRKDVPMTFIYGSRSWVDRDPGFKIKYIRKTSFVDVKILPGAGHHVYSDRAEMFNKLVISIGEYVDKGMLPTISTQETEDYQEENYLENISNIIKRKRSKRLNK